MSYIEAHAIRGSQVVLLQTDLTQAIVPLRKPGGYYAVGDYIRPRTPTGSLYVAVSAGFVGHREPRFGSDELRDGSVIWVPRGIGSAELPTIDLVAWSSSGAAGLTVAPEPTAGYRVGALVSGGVAGAEYRIVVDATLSTGEVIQRAWPVVVLA